MPDLRRPTAAKPGPERVAPVVKRSSPPPVPPPRRRERKESSASNRAGSSDRIPRARGTVDGPKRREAHRLDPLPGSERPAGRPDGVVEASDFDVHLLLAPIAPAHRAPPPVPRWLDRTRRREGGGTRRPRIAFGAYVAALMLVCASLGAWQIHALLRSTEGGRSILERTTNLVDRIWEAPQPGALGGG